MLPCIMAWASRISGVGSPWSAGGPPWMPTRVMNFCIAGHSPSRAQVSHTSSIEARTSALLGTDQSIELVRVTGGELE